MEYIHAGYISKQHGLRGNLLISILPDYSIKIKNTNFLYIEMESSKIPFEIEKITFSKNQTYLIVLKNYNSREKTNQFLNKKIFIDNKNIKSNNENLLELIDYKIVKNGIEVGFVKNFLIKEQTILFCHIDNKEVYIPYVDNFIKKIDHKKKKLYVNIPNDLLNLN
jgi:16S rRNA processing protein RimM|tara:strand:- start:2683 stop:3180 length:498 start_codon:yes stop_codon:yes gene_type:complete